jgi:hypothetical protein
MSGYAQWNPATTYPADEIVSYASALWQSLQTTTNNQPNISPLYWTQVGGGGAVSSIVAGTGISVSGTSTVTVSNTGVLSVASAGTGITIGGTASAPTVQNDGVLSVASAGTGITIGGTAQNPTVQNDGVLSVTSAGTGITIGGTAQNPTVQNDGVLALTAGTGVSITGSPSNYTISATGSGGTLTGIGAGTNITVDNSNPAVPVVSSSSAINGKVSTTPLTYNLANPLPINMGRYNQHYSCAAVPEGTGTDLGVAIIYNGDTLTRGYTNTFANTNGVDNIWIVIQSSPGVTYHAVQLNPNQAVVITASEDQSNLFTATRNRYNNA